MDSDRLLSLKPFVKIIPLQHARHSMPCGQLNQVRGGHLAHPLTVKNKPGLFRVKDLENLLLISAGIFQDLLAGQRLAGFILPRGVADHGSKITDQETNLMSQVLKLLELLDQNRVTDMQIRGCGVKPGLNPQRATGIDRFAKLFLKLRLHQNLYRATADHIHLLFD